MNKIKQRYCKECKVPVGKGKQYCPEHINRWHRPSTTHFKCKECNVTKPKRLFSKGHSICKPCYSKTHNGINSVFTYLGKELTNLLNKYKSSKRHQEKAIKVKIPQHNLDIKEVKKELAEFDKRVDKERRAIVYRYRQSEGRIKVNNRSIEKRKVKHIKWEKDIAQHIVDNFPPSDYSSKYDWTKSLFDVTKLLSKQYDIKISVLRKHINDIFGYKGTETAWIKHIDSKIKEIQPNYTGKAPWILECICCGNKQEKSSRSSLVRSLGLGGSNDKKNGGMCTDCSRAEKRTPHGPRTPEQVEKMRETAILNQTPFDSVEEWSESKIEKDTYYAAVDAMSRSNLRLYNPKEYERYMNNKWDGTNYETGLTIEHKTPKIICFQKGWSVKKAAHISNLKVVTQKENNRLWEEYAKKNNYKYVKKVKKATHNFW